jgi:hypothetical protein
MIDPLLKLTVKQKGTHVLPVSEWNNDVPNPASAVADALADLEYRIAELIRLGGAHPKYKMTVTEEAFSNLQNSVNLVNNALLAASEQNWKLELQQNPPA